MDIILQEGSKNVVLIEVQTSTLVHNTISPDAIFAYLTSLPGYSVGKVLSATAEGMVWITGGGSAPVDNFLWDDNGIWNDTELWIES